MAPTTSAARPKRAGEDFARAHDSTSKKPRFDPRNPSTLAADAPEEDVILDADVIGKSGPQTKRNAVNIDGYESDSDNDNFNERAAERERRKGNGTASREEEEDDIFAELEEGTGDGDEEEEEGLGRGGKKRGKDVRFMEQEEIEGQVMQSKSGGHVSADLLVGAEGKGKGKGRSRDTESESSSGDEEERDLLPQEMEDEFAAEVGAGGKKKHAPRLDAFNLREEEEEGRYDAAGNYVRKAADPDAVNDTWLDGLTKKDMKRAREAQEHRDNAERRRAAVTDALLTSDLLSTLIQHLEAGETALEALQRLNKGKRKDAKVPKWKQKKQHKDPMDLDTSTTTTTTTTTTDASTGPSDPGIDRAETARRAAVEAITGAADALYSREQHEIYDAERELLLRQFRRETGEDWRVPERKGDVGTGKAADEEEARWVFRWAEGGEEHGPYGAEAMRAWRDAGYFGEGVGFKRGGGGEWVAVLDV